MTSGVKVSDEVKDIFNKMKVVKNDDLDCNRIRLVSLHINEMIEVEKTYTQGDLGDCEAFKFFRDLLTKDKCRYFLYDCHFQTSEEIKKEELVFMLWAPDESGCKQKMKYASSKGAMDRVVEGVKHNLQINDLTDMERSNFADKLMGKGGKKLKKLEGNDVD